VTGYTVDPTNALLAAIVLAGLAAYWHEYRRGR